VPASELKGQPEICARGRAHHPGQTAANPTGVEFCYPLFGVDRRNPFAVVRVGFQLVHYTTVFLPSVAPAVAGRRA